MLLQKTFICIFLICFPSVLFHRTTWKAFHVWLCPPGIWHRIWRWDDFFSIFSENPAGCLSKSAAVRHGQPTQTLKIGILRRILFNCKIKFSLPIWSHSVLKSLNISRKARHQTASCRVHWAQLRHEILRAHMSEVTYVYDISKILLFISILPSISHRFETAFRLRNVTCMIGKQNEIMHFSLLRWTGVLCSQISPDPRKWGMLLGMIT